MLVCRETGEPFEEDERAIRQAELEVANASGHAAQQAARNRLERLREGRYAHPHGCMRTTGISGVLNSLLETSIIPLFAVTPPLKNVRKSRFRKTIRKKVD